MKQYLILFFSIIVFISCKESTSTRNSNENYSKAKWWFYAYENGAFADKMLAKIEYFSDQLITRGEFLNQTRQISAIETYEYDNSNNLLNMSFNFINRDEDDYYIIYTYKDNLLETEICYNTVDKRLSKYVYKYDEENKMIEELRYLYHGKGSIISEYTIYYFYDDLSNNFKKEYKGTGSEPFQIVEMKYDSENRILEFISTPNSGDIRKESYSYNNEGLLIENIFYSNGEILRKITYEYFYE